MCPNIVPLSSICIVFWYSGRVHINKQTSDFVFTSTNISNNNTPFSDGFRVNSLTPPNIHQTSTKGPLIKAQVDHSDLFFGAGRRAGDQMAGDPQLSHRLWTTPQIWDGLDTQATCKNPSKISSNASKGAGQLETIASKKGILPWFINYSTTYQLPSIFITWLVPQNPSIHLFFFGALSSNSRLS